MRGKLGVLLAAALIIGIAAALLLKADTDGGSDAVASTGAPAPQPTGTLQAAQPSGPATKAQKDLTQRKERRARVVMTAVVKRQHRPSASSDPSSSQLADNSPRASVLSGLLRSCSDARDFAVYTLGAKFEDLYASRVGAYCQKPPPVVRGRVAVPTRQNSTEVFYGLCKSTGGDCAYDVSVRSTPACEHPYWLYTAFTGPPGAPVDGPELVKIRGVPASVFEDRIELWTKESMVTVFAPTQAVARRAVSSLRVGQDDGTDATDLLPAPDPRVVATKKTSVKCPT